MLTVNVEELVNSFPRILQKVQAGEDVFLNSDDEKVAVLIPISHYRENGEDNPNQVNYGAARGKLGIQFHDFDMTDEDLLHLNKKS